MHGFFLLMMVSNTNEGRIDIQFDCSSVSGSHGFEIKQTIRMILKLPVYEYLLIAVYNHTVYRSICR
jgi:hypothetical protein